MPNGPTNRQLREWYKNFSELLLKNADIDVNLPEALGLIKNIQVTKWDTTNPETPDVTVTYAYLPQGGNEPVVPAPQDARSQQYQDWLRDALKPAVTNEQIRQLYNMSREGTLMIAVPEKGLKDIQMVYTDPDGKITMSQPASVYRDGGNNKLPAEDRIPDMPVKPASSLKPEDYNIPSRPVAPPEPANMHPGFWSWLGDLLGMDTDYTKLKNYELAMSAYEEEAAQWDRDLIEKQSYTVTNKETNEEIEVAHDEYRLARYEHEQYAQQLEAFKLDPMGKFSAIANSAAKLGEEEEFWVCERISAQSNFLKTPRGKEKEALNNINEMVRFEERTDSLIHNWLGHNGIPSKVKEWNANFRTDNLQLKQLELPKDPGFDQMTASEQSTHLKNMTELFDLAAFGALGHPDILAKEPRAGCTEHESAFIIFTPMLNDMFTSFRDNATEYFKYIEPAREKALNALTAYTQGNKGPLGELLGCCMRQVLRDCAQLSDLSARAINDTYLVGKLYNVLQDPDLLKASGLNENELQEARANMELYQIMRQGLQAQKDILDHGFGKRTLSPEQLKQAAQDVMICHSTMLSLHDGCKESEANAQNSEEYVNLTTNLLNRDFSKLSAKGGRVQGDKREASPYEIASNRLNLLITYLPANKFTMQLADKNWVNQYKQAIMDQSDMSKIGEMSRDELRNIFSKKNSEIASTLMSSSKPEAPEQNAPEVQVQKQAENGMIP